MVVLVWVVLVLVLATCTTDPMHTAADPSADKAENVGHYVAVAAISPLPLQSSFQILQSGRLGLRHG